MNSNSIGRNVEIVNVECHDRIRTPVPMTGFDYFEAQLELKINPLLKNVNKFKKNNLI
jgi:hypothetical protein